MKSIRLIAISAIITLSAFCAVLYSSSCKKDACLGVSCKNNAPCNGGTCVCPTGISGANCEIVYRNMYANTYKGTGSDNLSNVYPNYKLVFSKTSDTTEYTKMNLQVVDSVNVVSVSLPVVLYNNTAGGSNITIAATGVDTFTYSGTGVISANAASVDISKKGPNSAARLFTFKSFIKQ